MFAVIDYRTPISACHALAQHGLSLIKLPPNPKLAAPVAGHPDMLLFFGKDGIFCASSYLAFARESLSVLSKKTARPVIPIDEEPKNVYPFDVLLNAVPIGKHLFCHAAHTAKMLLNHRLYQPVPVRQGYAKCSVIPVSDTAMITDDPSIATAASQQGIDVLQLSSHGVRLTGYDTGFIGGAASFAPYGNYESIFFCGRLEDHPEADKIKEFCKKYQKSVISLGDFPLTDVGTIFLI